MPVSALVPVPTFEVLLGRLEDKDVVKLPERIHLAALTSLELSKEVTGDLEQEGTRKEIIERYYIEHGKPPAGMPADAHMAVQPTPQPAQLHPRRLQLSRQCLDLAAAHLLPRWTHRTCPGVATACP